MNIPIETVVELLMANYCLRANGHCYVLVPGGSVSCKTGDDPRTAIREYLEALAENTNAAG